MTEEPEGLAEGWALSGVGTGAGLVFTSDLTFSCFFAFGGILVYSETV